MSPTEETERPAEDAPDPGRSAALAARNAIEEALFALQDIPLDFDRAALRDMLLRAISCVYAVLDTQVIAAAHLDGLTEGAAIVAGGRALLAQAGDPAGVEPLRQVLARLDAAEAALRGGASAVMQIQFERRTELVSGLSIGEAPKARPFRASLGVPELHALARPLLLPHILVDPAAPIPARSAPPAAAPRPRTIEALQAFAAEAASGELERRYLAPDQKEAPEASAPPPLAYEPSVEDAEVLRRLGRDCLEDIANHRNLRKPNAIESWLDQEPFEQRILDNIDAFAAIGGSVLPLVSLFHAEARSPDPERAFAVALTLGCIAGSDTVGASVMTLKQSPPEELPGWCEGFWLAPNPAIDVAMAELCMNPRSELVSLALDVLHARRSTPASIVGSLLERAEPAIAQRIARALATVLPQREAVGHLERVCATTDDDDLFLTAMESLLRRGYGPAVDLLRRTIDAPPSPARGQKALPLLCLVGRASDTDCLVRAANAAPTGRILRGLGRFGHVKPLDPLINFLEHADKELVSAAAEALERITGAGLRELVEEPWEVELPPEAEEAGGIPIPTRKVERIVTDPERWSVWVRENAWRFNSKVKLRGGVPFAPMQIVDELEARSTPPDRREEAALELALVTGISSPFSPHDWVARQRQVLADLRARVAKIPSTPGTWLFSAAGHTGEVDDGAGHRAPTRHPSAPAIQVQTAPERLFRPARAPDEPSLPAQPPGIAAGHAGNHTLPPPALIAGTKAPLPFSRQAIHSPEDPVAAVPADHPVDSTLPLSARLPVDEVAKNPLPFRPLDPASPGARIGTVPTNYPLDATLPVAGLVTKNPLPFQAATPERPERATSQRAASPASSAPVTATLPLIRPEKPVLPFKPPTDPPVSVPAAGMTAGDSLHSQDQFPLPAWVAEAPLGYTGDQTLPPAGVTERAKNPLPFAAQAPPPSDAPGAAALVDHPGAETPRVPGVVTDNPLPFKPAPAAALPQGPPPQASTSPSPPPTAPEPPSPPSSEPATARWPAAGPAFPPLPSQRSSMPRVDPSIAIPSLVAPPSEEPPLPSLGPTSRLTLEQYASLCAELTVFPQRNETIFQQYGLQSLRERLTVDLAWQERLRRNPTEYREWQGLYRRYHTYWVEQARRGGTR